MHIVAGHPRLSCHYLTRGKVRKATTFPPIDSWPLRLVFGPYPLVYIRASTEFSLWRLDPNSPRGQQLLHIAPPEHPQSVPQYLVCNLLTLVNPLILGCAVLGMDSVELVSRH